MYPFCAKCNRSFASNYTYRRHVHIFHKQPDNDAQFDPAQDLVVTEQDKLSVKDESATFERKEKKQQKIESFSPLWSFWLIAAAEKIGLRKWSDLEDNYAEFMKEFCREAYEKCRAYQELIDNDAFFSQLRKEECRLYALGYKEPGEAWQRSWSNHKYLIKNLVKLLKKDIQQEIFH